MIRVRIYYIIIALNLMLCLGAFSLAMAANGSVPNFVWQDTDNVFRQKAMLAPNTQLSGQSANVEGRSARVRSQYADPNKVANAVPYLGMLQDSDWRLRIRSAAVASGEMVTLGDIADPLGNIPSTLWHKLAATKLWPAPTVQGKPFQVNKARLNQALYSVLNDVADRCIVPTSLAIQSGGMVLYENELRSFVLKSLYPQMSALPGNAELSEIRLPPYIFLAHEQQRVELEPAKIVPGRIIFRFVVKEMDGENLKRIAGTAFLNLWVEVPAAARNLNKGNELTPESITFIRMNVAHMREMPWDGRGGPWQMIRAIGEGQPIFQGDLATTFLVQKGSVVNLLYIKNNIRIQAKGEVMADGEPGGMVLVRNVQTKKEVYAIVKDRYTVHVQ